MQPTSSAEGQICGMAPDSSDLENNEDSGTATSAGQTVVNEVKGPDQEKGAEVEAMEQQYQKEFPLLKQRFQTGAVTKDPLEMMGLVQETAEFMLLPVRKCMGQRAIVVLGITGAGKSTFSNWLLGHELKKVEDTEGEDDDAVSINITEPSFVVGHGNSSKTFAPNVKEMKDGTLVVDFPGFMDTNGIEIRIGMDLAFRRMIEWLKPAHVLALVPIDGFEAGRGTLLRQQISKLTRLLPTSGAPLGNGATASPEEACAWMVGVTKCDRDFIKKPNSKFKDAVMMLQDIGTELDPENIVNINEWMFAPKVQHPRQRLKELILGKTKTPTVANARLTEETDKCFPSSSCAAEVSQRMSQIASWWQGEVQPKDPYPSCLVSDCLSPVEMESFQKALSTTAFCDVFLREDEEKAKDAYSDDSAGGVGWQKMRTVFKQYTESIKTDSDGLVKLCLLSTERREPRVHELCSHRQCRLKACFVKVEEKIMAKNMERIQEVQQTYIEQYQHLKAEVPILPDHCDEVEGKIKQVEESFQADVLEMGHDDLPAFLQYASTALGVVTTTGGIGMLVHVTCTSTSLAAYLAGQGSWAALSAGATAGLTTGGVALGGALLFMIVAFAVNEYRKGGAARSRDAASMLMDSMDDLVVAHRAVSAHMKKLAAIRTALDCLLVNPKD